MSHEKDKKMFFDPPTHLNNSGADRSPGDEDDSC